MPTGYEDIDNLNNQVSQLYDEQMKQQENIINTSTQQTIDEIERNKQKTQQEVEKTNRALYTDYQKQINPYGVNAENLAEQGLGKSGLAETTKARYYNTYQSARTEAQNNADKIYADLNAELVKARQNADLQLATSKMEIYKQRVNDLYNTYNLAYQRKQDDLTQSNWEKEYNRAVQQAQWEQAFNQAQFDYQKERDAVADSQWERQYELSKKASSSSRSSGGSSYNNVNNISEDNTIEDITIDDIIKNLKFVQGASVEKSIYDSYSGKYFSSPQEVINYWKNQ